MINWNLLESCHVFSCHVSLDPSERNLLVCLSIVIALSLLSLPPRYALDFKVEKAEDVLTHRRLLKLAEDPATRPVFEVRDVQVLL